MPHGWDVDAWLLLPRSLPVCSAGFDTCVRRERAWRESDGDGLRQVEVSGTADFRQEASGEAGERSRRAERAARHAAGAGLYRQAARLFAEAGKTDLAVKNAFRAVLGKKAEMLLSAGYQRPAAWAAFVSRLLAKDPAGRPATAADVVAAVKALPKGSAAPPTSATVAS